MSRVYVGRLPYRANERDLEHFFKGYGRITEVILKNGYAFVEFNEQRDADDASHDLDGRELMGERITVEMARGIPRGRDRYNWNPQPSSRNYDRYSSGGRRNDRRYSSRGGDYRIIVENLSSRVSWQDLKDLFRSIGEVTYADAHGKHKNEGVVEFASRSDMKRALDKLDGKDMNGRKIKLIAEKGGSRSRSRSRQRSASGSRSRSRSLEQNGRQTSQSPKDTKDD